VKTFSLRNRLLAIIVMGVLTISTISLVLDYHQQYRLGIRKIYAILQENARTLYAAHQLMSDPNLFERYVHDFCAQMNEELSPGHIIMVLDPNDRLIARSFHDAHDNFAQRALLQNVLSNAVLFIPEHRLAAHRFVDSDGMVWILAQYLDHMEFRLKEYILERSISMLIVAAVIILSIWGAIHFWVVKPIRALIQPIKRWAHRDFSARAPYEGPSDFHILADEVNAMARELETHDRQHADEMGQAAAIQKNLLPRAIERAAGLGISAYYRPAEHVAGDLYDIWNIRPALTACMILDVSGHGISAALLTGVAKMSLRHHLEHTGHLSEAVRGVNQDLIECIAEGYFVTACIGVWNARRCTWTYCSAGHPGGIFLSRNGTKTLSSTSPLLGVMPMDRFQVQTIPLSPGDRLYLYTDGLTEVETPDGLYGDHRLAKLIARTRTQSLERQVAYLADHIIRLHSGPVRDDITLIGLESKRLGRHNGGSAARAVPTSTDKKMLQPALIQNSGNPDTQEIVR